MSSSFLDTEKILTWKEKYWKIYHVVIADNEFIYRQISRKEFRVITESLENDYDKEDEICRICTLYPENFNFLRAPGGLSTTLAAYILSSSGKTEDSIDEVRETLSKYREEMKTLDNQISCIITEAFPQFGIEEVENWPLDKSLWFLSRAEYVINELRASIREHGGLVYQSYQPEELPNPNKKEFKERVKKDIDKSYEKQVQEKPKIKEPIKEEVKEESKNNQIKEKIKELPNNPILEDPNFDVGLLFPEEAAKRKVELNGSYSDFPELSEIDKFMKGEIKID